MKLACAVFLLAVAFRLSAQPFTPVGITSVVIGPIPDSDCRIGEPWRYEYITGKLWGCREKKWKWENQGASTASEVVNLFTGCMGTQYLGADGACHTASGVALTGFGTFTFSNIPDGGCQENTFNLPGVIVGDKLSLSWPTAVSDQAGIIGIMIVSAADTIKVRVCNLSGGSASIPSADYGVDVVR